MDFVFTKLIFTVRLERDIADSCAMFGIKNSFMKAFRAAACTRDGLCEHCPVRDSCSFSLTFSQSISEDSAAVKRHQKPSLPFVFHLPLLPAAPNEGREVEIGLVLAGSAINHVKDYLTAVSLLFSPGNTDWRVNGRVVKAESVTCTDYRNNIMEKSGKMAVDAISTISARDLEEIATLDPNRVRLEISTPVRLLQDGKTVHDFSFSSFVRPLMRRISSLAYYYYGNGLEFDYKWLSSASMSVVLTENDFHWCEWGGDRHGERLAGIVGSGVCEGPLADFHTLLLLGEYFNVGKGAPFGLGGYRLEKVI
jgi:hypothetical protein